MDVFNKEAKLETKIRMRIMDNDFFIGIDLYSSFKCRTYFEGRQREIL
jgi:hypothetical protein